MAAFDERREPDWIAGLTHISATAAYGRGDLDLALQRFEESLRRHREMGETWLTAQALDGIARIALRRGDIRQAASLLTEGLPLHREFPTPEMTILWLTPVASLAMAMGEMADAARLLGAATTLREAFDIPLELPERAEVEVATAAVRSALGETAFAMTWEEGSKLSIEDAVHMVGDRLLTAARTGQRSHTHLGPNATHCIGGVEVPRRAGEASHAPEASRGT
jgi:ATP/maltotriose-dependent transcriptional regulator MalT